VNDEILGAACLVAAGAKMLGHRDAFLGEEVGANCY
jgi:hypothetical protein